MSPDKESFSEKLKSLGVQVGLKHIPPPAPLKKYGIEEVIPGFDLSTPTGETFVCEQHYPNDYQHGWISLCQNCALEHLSAWGSISRMTDPSIPNVVFLDTETTGLAGGAGTNAFLIGVGYRTLDGFHLVQFFMRDPAQEAALLTGLNQWLSPFNVVVTFNGKTFDIPLLNTRYTMNRVPSPFGAYDHLDLLGLARQLWRDRLPSRALGKLEKEIVRFHRTGEDIPGEFVPQLYFDYLDSGDARPLAGVFYHNAMDILSLAALFNHVAALLTDPGELLKSVDGGGIDLAAIARIYENKGWWEQAAGLYESSLDYGLPEEIFHKTIDRYAAMCHKKGDWEQAVKLWQKSAERGNYEACIELAKYYEHRSRDYTAALQWTQRAQGLVHTVFHTGFYLREAQADLQRRANRITKKMEHS